MFRQSICSSRLFLYVGSAEIYYMGSKIFLLKDGDELQEMVETPYDSEDLLQQLLKNHPALLAGDQIDPTEPRRWLLITREMGVPDSDDGTGRWALDHLFIDQDGIPTLVEVKRSCDTRTRREVVAQMLDYAANSVQYWNIGDIIRSFTHTCGEKGADPEEELAAFLSGSIDPEEYWDIALANLRQGKIRLLFVADIIPPELKRIIEFLNEQMNPAEVLGVEVKQYTGRKEKTLVSRVVGQTMRAIDTKKVRSGKPRQWDRESLLLQVQERAGNESVRIVDHVLEWAETHNFSLKYGKGAHEGSATIGLDLPGGNYCRIITMNGGGSIAPNFDILLGFPPFDQREMRLKMLNRLGRESNIQFDPNKVNTWSNRPLSPLADENHFHAFCKTLEWVRGELEEHHRLAGAQSG